MYKTPYKFCVGDYVWAPLNNSKFEITNINSDKSFYVTADHKHIPVNMQDCLERFDKDGTLYICEKSIGKFYDSKLNKIEKGTVVKYDSRSGRVIDANNNEFPLTRRDFFEYFMPWNVLRDVKEGDIVVTRNLIMKDSSYTISIVDGVSEPRNALMSKISWNSKDDTLTKNCVIWRKDSYYDIAPASDNMRSILMDKLKRESYVFKDSDCLYAPGRALDLLLREFDERLKIFNPEGLSPNIIKRKERITREIERTLNILNKCKKKK